jgi:hypothetical protein
VFQSTIAATTKLRPFCPVLLVLVGSVSQFAETTEKHSPRQGVSSLAFVKAGLNALTQFDVAGEPGCCSMYAATVIGFAVFEALKPAPLRPVQELADGVIICDPCILVTDWNREEFEKALGRFRSDIGDNGWHLK